MAGFAPPPQQYASSVPQCDTWTTSPPGRWTTGLCGCCEDCSSCCCGIWCPCILVGQNVELLSDGRTGFSTGCIVSYFLLNFFPILTCIYTCGYRRRLREKFNLPPGCGGGTTPGRCHECCIHCCCLQCALCQETRELKNRGWDPSITYNANVLIFQQRFQNTAPPSFQSMAK
eukprot:TRINITY_DN35554_c0_g1_i1.p2 TRINITY_DN35554_c0_g1~~TRINITY_DN35554_c0_g1_i1.p2  ORF type:complete len:173 (-),score=22.11 TRINITY_DN35554_c0_g1_i1:905-1423(-)